MKESSAILLTENFENLMKVGGEVACFTEEYNASTGYQWKVSIDNSGVYSFIETTTLHPSTEAVGVPGLMIWTFEALKPGNGDIRFELYPPGSEEPVKTVFVKLAVS